MAAGSAEPLWRPYIMCGMADRTLTPLDQLLIRADQALRATLGRPAATRENPALGVVDHLADGQERQHAAGLMRLNHAGEVAAQGLYHGQAITARSQATRAAMSQAAREEGDHLAWCRDRLDELGAAPSLLSPLWYSGALAIGLLAGLGGDRYSFGFMAETERQVEGHLDDQLSRLPADDARSRAILEQMKADEIGHARTAIDAGGAELPAPVRLLMRAAAGVMTRTAYRF